MTDLVGVAVGDGVVVNVGVDVIVAVAEGVNVGVGVFVPVGVGVKLVVDRLFTSTLSNHISELQSAPAHIWNPIRPCE